MKVKYYKSKTGQPFVATGNKNRNAICDCGSSLKVKRCTCANKRGYKQSNVKIEGKEKERIKKEVQGAIEQVSNAAKKQKEFNSALFNSAYLKQLQDLTVTTVKNPPLRRTSKDTIKKLQDWLTNNGATSLLDLVPDKYDEYAALLDLLSKPREKYARI